MPPQQKPARGFLVSVGLNPELMVEFQYNPNQLSDKRSVSYVTLNAPGQLLPVRQYNQGGDRTLTFTVRLDGLFAGTTPGTVDNDVYIERDENGSILPELNKYRAFLYPRINRSEYWKEARSSFVPLYADQLEFTSPPTCRFGFGFGSGTREDWLIDCLVMDIGITETLFNSLLLPLRADIAITLVELSPYGNTPTSPPGG